ncbi:MAG: hypothetical protein AB1454_12750 [Candidatus Auribacterota bacterium]
MENESKSVKNWVRHYSCSSDTIKNEDKKPAFYVSVRCVIHPAKIAERSSTHDTGQEQPEGRSGCFQSESTVTSCIIADFFTYFIVSIIMKNGSAEKDFKFLF